MDWELLMKWMTLSTRVYTCSLSSPHKSGSTCCTLNSPPPRTRGYFEDARTNYSQLIKPCAPLKVKSHAGIAGNECADAVAMYQATHIDASHAETGWHVSALVVTRFMT